MPFERMFVLSYCLMEGAKHYLLNDAVAIAGASSCTHDLAVSIVEQHIGDDDQHHTEIYCIGGT